jgi:hypothetical protein
MLFSQLELGEYATIIIVYFKLFSLHTYNCILNFIQKLFNST